MRPVCFERWWIYRCLPFRRTQSVEVCSSAVLSAVVSLGSLPCATPTEPAGRDCPTAGPMPRTNAQILREFRESSGARSRLVLRAACWMYDKPNIWTGAMELAAARGRSSSGMGHAGRQCPVRAARAFGNARDTSARVELVSFVAYPTERDGLLLAAGNSSACECTNRPSLGLCRAGMRRAQPWIELLPPVARRKARERGQESRPRVVHASPSDHRQRLHAP